MATALEDAGIVYAHESQGKELTNGLDFRLNVHPPVYIEIKAFHAERIGRQMAQAENVIVLQGKAAVDFFCLLLNPD